MSRKQPQRNSLRLQEFIFYSNYFYGLCAVALSVEAALQQRYPLNGILYFGIVFITTVLYYSYPYIRKCTIISSNPRTNWYTRNYKLMWWQQVIITIILLLSLILFLCLHWKAVMAMTIRQWSLVLVFPFVAALYYGINALHGRYNLRKVGWLKPFIIGFTWAGLVTVYPVLFYDIIHQQEYLINWIVILLFVKNFMFVTVLCIMFDIKDYAADYLSRVRTFVVKLGLRRTIFYILVPLSLIGLASFIYYAVTHHFNYIRVLLNVIPFILLITVAWSLRRRRSILYYLIVVDGLMLIKAVCGTIAISFF
jgi:hypothetical protein